MHEHSWYLGTATDRGASHGKTSGGVPRVHKTMDDRGEPLWSGNPPMPTNPFTHKGEGAVICMSRVTENVPISL